MRKKTKSYGKKAKLPEANIPETIKVIKKVKR